MKNLISLFILLFTTILLNAQEGEKKSIHQQELEYYKSLKISALDYENINIPSEVTKFKTTRSCNLNKVVFGWHPYWSNGLEDNYDWNLLSDFTYFSYEVDYNTGNAVTTNNWATASSVTKALAHGVRVNLCVTLFSNHTTFFNNSTAQQTLITNIKNLLQQRGAHGVNIDFEGVAAINKTAFTNFLILLSNQLHAVNPNYKLSVCLYAVDWNNVFDISAIDQYVDYYTIMGYDYYYSGSSTTGPTAPLYSYSSFDYSLARSLGYYISKGASKEKLVLALPYYGQDWATNSSNVPSNTSANGSARTYKSIKINANGYYSNRQYEENSVCPYYVYNAGGYHHCFCDDEESLATKYDFVNLMGIAGIGIWALGYDDGYNNLWNAIKEKFTDCNDSQCNGIFYDLAGPIKNYYNNMNYSFTIAPEGATQILLSFPEFDIEAGSAEYCNYDYIEIFDGENTEANSLGKFCNTTGNPGTITSSGNALTIKVYTDGATVKSGFKGEWTCIIDNTVPTTEIQISNDWKTEDFYVNFIDQSNSEINYKFYLVTDYDGNEWRANSNFDFFYDNFSNTTINSEWTVGSAANSGNWNIYDNYLKQSDETTAFSKLYTQLSQNQENTYLYHWKMRLSGTSSTEKRAGIYFFSDDPTANYCGNAYMVYFRTNVNPNKCEIYKAGNNTISDIIASANITVNQNVFYDYKVIYNPSTGKILVFQDDSFILQWTDTEPLTIGNAISLRSGGCVADYDDIMVYKTREEIVNITVGDNLEVRYQNSEYLSPACKIYSVIINKQNKFSEINFEKVNIDWTAPEQIPYVNDGLSEDIDTTYNNLEISGNWGESFEQNSKIVEYQYCIGTTSGGNDIIDWTNNANNLNFNNTNIILDTSYTYYISVRAKNSANLFSVPTTSNGFIYNVFNEYVNINQLSINQIEPIIYPNPAKEYFEIINTTNHFETEIFNLSGKLIYHSENIKRIYLNNYECGIYIVKIKFDNSEFFRKIVIN